MNYIFISPTYPDGHWRYAAAQRLAGHHVLGLGDAGDETFRPELRGNLTEYRRVGDLHDYDAVYRTCAYFVSRYGRIDDIESLNPYWCDLVEALNMEFCDEPILPAECWESMAVGFADSPLLPVSARVSSADEAAAFAAEHGWPLLAVPVSDKRPWQRLTADAGQLAALFSVPAGKTVIKGEGGSAAPYDGDWMLYAQIAGEPISVDGLCGLGDDGRQMLTAVAAHAVREDGALWYVPLSDEERERVLELVAQTVECGFFHIDAVRLPSAVKGLGKRGELLFNAVEDAPPHEYVMDCMNIEFDCDLRAVWAGMGDVNEPLERRYCAGAACRRFGRCYRNSHEKILRRLADRLKIHERTADSDKTRFGDYVYIFRGTDAAELRRGVKYITEDFAK